MDCTFHDAIAEQSALAIALADPANAAEPVAQLPLDVWWGIERQTIATVIRELALRREPVDVARVADQAVRRVGSDSQGRQIAKLVMDLYTAAPPTASIGWYLDRLREVARVRRLAEHVTATEQRINTMISNGAPEEMSNALVALERGIAECRGDGEGDLPQTLSVRELVEDTELEFDWVVPGLLERTDRMILTAREGVGKSYLLAQIALCCAAGVHPFLGDFMPGLAPMRTLVVDVENSRRQLARRYERVVGMVNRIVHDAGEPPVDWHTQMKVVLRPEGVDIANPREVARIEQAIAQQAPDLVVMGPLYRMHHMNTAEEQPAKELTDAIDRLRVHYGFAVLCEAHVPHRSENLAPIGSSLFRRWPEFGYGMAPPPDFHGEHPQQIDLMAWRGGRDNRDFPSRLRHGFRLPWEPVWQGWGQRLEVVE